MWAHDHWGLTPEDAPDIVTFAKKAQIAGFFSECIDLRIGSIVANGFVVSCETRVIHAPMPPPPPATAQISAHCPSLSYLPSSTPPVCLLPARSNASMHAMQFD